MTLRPEPLSLSTHDVRWSTAGRLIVKDVSIEVAAGRVVGLLGPNGSGKTSLLRLLSHLLEPAAGSVTLDGQPVGELGRRGIARQLAVLTQDASTDFQPTVADVVMLGRIPHQSGMRGPSAEDHAIVEESLGHVGVGHLARRAYPTLSGGERQRTQLARTLAQQTPVLLLDEPSNHLDVAHQYGLMHTVRELRVTTIAALHDLNLAAACCDELIVLEGGEVVCAGTPAEVITASLVRRVWDVPCAVTTAGRPARPHVVFYPGGQAP